MKYAIIGIIMIVSSLFINYYLQRKIFKRTFTLWYRYLYGDLLSLLFLGLIIATQIPLVIKYDVTVSFGIYSILIILLITIAWIDLKTKKIPNILVIIGGVLGLISMLINSDVTILDSTVGAIIISSILIAISLITKGAIGMGDAKIFFFIGLFLGFWTSISVFTLSILVSGLISLVLLMFGVVKRKTTIPFAPFIFISAFLVIIIN